MPDELTELRTAVAGLTAGGDFDGLALRIFRFQRRHNPTYRRWLDLSGQLVREPQTWREIPCLPIDFFRSHDLRSGRWQPETTFTSSGTTGAATSSHPVIDLRQYRSLCRATFEHAVGRPLVDFRLLALLPSYLERSGSGLIAMVEGFIEHSAGGSGFFLYDHDGLRQAVDDAAAEGQAVLLWGVPYALLDLLESDALVLPAGSVVVETGGMKGRRRELIREELHKRLQAGIRLRDGRPAPILSEYGMTEMNSQAYRLPERGSFAPAAALRVAVRDQTDPFASLPFGKTGALNVYDLANVATCSFIQTDDLGRLYADGTFDLLGRQDGARVRGCNLLV